MLDFGIFVGVLIAIRVGSDRGKRWVNPRRRGLSMSNGKVHRPVPPSLKQALEARFRGQPGLGGKALKFGIL